jgi:hypothetical protein
MRQRRTLRIAPSRTRPGLAIVVLLALLPAHATTAELSREALSGGAMSTSAGSYLLDATVGEVGVVGFVQSNEHSLGMGFWQGMEHLRATAAPEAMAEVHFVNGLRQNFPNPFAGETALSFTVGARSPVRLRIFDVTGRRVATLFDQAADPGRYDVRWEGQDDTGSFVSTGIYFCRLDVGSWTETRKMLRLR